MSENPENRPPSLSAANPIYPTLYSERLKANREEEHRAYIAVEMIIDNIFCKYTSDKNWLGTRTYLGDKDHAQDSLVLGKAVEDSPVTVKVTRDISHNNQGDVAHAKRGDLATSESLSVEGSTGFAQISLDLTTGEATYSETRYCEDELQPALQQATYTRPATPKDVDNILEMLDSTGLLDIEELVENRPAHIPKYKLRPTDVILASD